jgi:hypothetical protein
LENSGSLIKIFSILGQFKKEYPDAKVIGVEGLSEKKKAEGLVLDGGKHLSLTFFLSPRNVFAHGDDSLWD